MSLIDAALSRARTVIAALLLLLVAGAVAYITIPKESDPDVNIPIVYVSLSHDGISPEDAERLLIRPMETELRSIEGVKEMRSVAFQGGASVLLEFDAGFDVDQALADVREKVDLVKPDLPDDTDEPTVNEVNISLFPILVVTLGGDVPERTLLRLARDLRDRIEGIPSVLEVKIVGDRREQMEVIIDPVLMDSYGLEAQQIVQALNRSNILIAAGALDTGRGRFALQVPGLFETVRDIMDMPVKVEGDSVVTIGEIVTARRTFRDRQTIARLAGQPAISLEISKRTGENIIDTIEQVRAVVASEQAQSAWPDLVAVSFSQDRSVQIRTMLDDLQNNVLSAILLVMIVVVGALGVRGGILVGLAIPGSFLTGILVLSILGLTINIVVLFALILAVGMLVDGAIVVTEYADRKLREGEPPERAFALAAKRMAWPIIASTATTLAAFAPLLLWPGLVGEFMKFLPITLLATLSASLAMALIFVPVLGANQMILTRIIFVVLGMVAGTAILLLAADQIFGRAELSGTMTGRLAAAGIALAGALAGCYVGLEIGDRIVASLGRTSVQERARMQAFAGASQADVTRLRGPTGWYLRVLAVALHHPGKVIAMAAAVLVGSWILYATYGKGIEFFPEVEPDQAIVQVHARGNLSVAEKIDLVGEVERRVLDLQDDRQEFKTIYTSAGNLDSRDDNQPEDVIGFIQLEFVDWEQRRPADEILADIRARTGNIAGLIVVARKPRAGPPVGKPVQVQLGSRQPELLAAETAKVRAFMDRLPGLFDVEDSRPMPGIEWQLDVDRAQAAKFGADVRLIGDFVKLVSSGLKVSAYRPDDSDQEIDIVVRYPIEYRTIDQLDRIRVSTEDGRVPIANFVERKALPRTGLLRRVDGRRIMKVSAEVAPGVLADDKVKEISAWIETAGIDPRVEVTFKGEDQEQKDAEAFLAKAFAIALFIMAIILVTQFNSFYSAFLILSAVIMSTVGVLLGLLITGQPFGIIMSGIGVIALAGIVVNNNIVLIDTYDRLRRTERDAMQAILRTGAQRLRPVLLTTVTTVFGLMPMVLQLNINFMTRQVAVGAPSTQWWVQLSTAVAFGLTFATVLTLIVTPSALMVKANIASWRAATGDAAWPPGKIDVPEGGLPEAAE